MLRRIASACLLLFAPLAASAADPVKTGFVDKVFKNADGSESPYVVFVPAGYDPAKPCPIILFLHGSGETKGGAKMPVEQGIAPHIKRNEKTFPAVVVIPQSEKRTWKADSEDAKRAMAMLDATAKEYNADPARTYLTGLSMGGYGTWSLAAAYPDRWAAIVPICGGGDPKDAEKIKDIPCWCWHGGADRVVKPEKSVEMIEALQKAGGKPRYTQLNFVGHNSWDAAYATPELADWLLKQKQTK